MSFSSEIKSELCKLENRKDCCRRAECYGLWLFSKCFTLGEGVTVTEHPDVARRMLELAAAVAGISGELRYGFSRRERPVYTVSIPAAEDRLRLLACFGHSGREPSLRINRAVLEQECCVQAFLRGAFLACGMAADPQKGYHLEYSVPYRNLANGLYTLLCEVEAFSVQPALGSRKGASLVYWKDGDQIENLLTYLGAVRASMDFMQVRMYKEMRNDINRKTNFETANMDKTYSAAARQIAAIAALSDAGELERLPEELRDLAVLRLENPEMTLRELGEILRISRSGVNHRLRKLVERGEALLREELEAGEPGEGR